MAAVGLKSPTVASQELMEQFEELIALELWEELLRGHEDRRVADEPALAVDDLGELVEGLEAVAGPGLRSHLGGTRRHMPVGLGLGGGGGGLELGKHGRHID